MPHKGLTLVELMVTLAIVGLLVTASFGVVGAMARSQAAALSTDGPGPSEARLRALVLDDLTHADRYREVPGGLELELHAMIDPATLDRRHTASTVSYRIVRLGTTPWLVRSQQVAGQDTLTELAGPAIQKVALEGPNVATSVSQDGWFAMPRAGAVVISRTVTGAAATAPAVNSNLAIRFETGER
jgi:prepilin-type N-terminal cleavage/methylation domain-containing protein